MWFRLVLFSVALWIIGGTKAVLLHEPDTYSQWPLSNSRLYLNEIFIYNPDNFTIIVNPQHKRNCSLMSAAIQRFTDSMKTMQDIVTKKRNVDKKYMELKADVEEKYNKMEDKRIDVKDPTHTINETRRFKRGLVVAHRQPIPEKQLYAKPMNPTHMPHEHPVSDMVKERTTTSQKYVLAKPKQEHSTDYLIGLSINLVNETDSETPQEYPYYRMNENYHIEFVNGWIVLYCSEIWGVMRGLETISQLFFLSTDYREIAINKTVIIDKPNYPHRGLLLDTARHYISVDNILKTLDAMAMNKMNVFHWLLANDESFPFQSEKHPEISEAAAFHPKLVYTKSDIKKVVEFARTLGIRVIPELDIPVHVSSIRVSHPNVIVECVSGGAQLNPIVDETYELFGDLYHEILTLFPDEYFHFGGSDIYDLQMCWQEDPIISQYIIQNNITSEILLAKFYERMATGIPPEKKIIVWEDAFYNSASLNNAMVEINKDSGSDAVRMAIEEKKQIIWSSPYNLHSGDSDFFHLYMRDPRSITFQYIQCSILLQKYVIGAEATVTTQTVDDSNIHSEIWPRASAVAEVLWTDVRERRWMEAHHTLDRIKTQGCRMQRRGIPVTPIDSSFCVTVDNVIKKFYYDFGRLL